MDVSLPSRPPPIHRLPEELLYKILLLVYATTPSSTPAQLAISLAWVCNRWHNVIHSSGQFWNKINSSQGARRVREALVRSMNAPLFVIITINLAKIDSTAILLEQAQRFESLRLTLPQRLPNAEADNLSPQLPNLRHLALIMDDWDPLQRNMPLLARCGIDHLRELEVTKARFRNITHLLSPTLVSLHLESIRYGDFDECHGFLKALGHLHNLQELHLSWSLLANVPEALKEEVIHFKSMRDMMLADCPAACLWFEALVGLPRGFFPTLIFTVEASEEQCEELWEALDTVLPRRSPPPVGKIAIDGRRFRIWPPDDPDCACPRPLVDVTFAPPNGVLDIVELARQLPLRDTKSFHFSPADQSSLSSGGWHDFDEVFPNVETLVLGDTPLRDITVALAAYPEGSCQPPPLFPRLKNIHLNRIRFTPEDGVGAAERFVDMLRIRRQNGSGIVRLEIRGCTLFSDLHTRDMVNFVEALDIDHVRYTPMDAFRAYYPGGGMFYPRLAS